MNNMIKNGFLFSLSLLVSGVLFSQTAINISGTQVVKKGETFTIEGGQTIVFEPGATLQVEGSLLIKGNAESPVIVKSSDPLKSGNGFMIVGIDEAASVEISHVKFQNLIQPMRFDPFWYRKSVKISDISISGSNSGEPMIYVAGPFLDLREGMDIDFKLTGSKFFNNTGNVLLEKVGSDGINYILDGLMFNENALQGDDKSMGVLHLDFANSINVAGVKLGEFAFNRNTSGNSEVGLSISGGNGTGSEKIAVAGVYSESNVVNVILDRRSDSRLPSLDVNKLGSLSEYPQQKDFVLNGTHKFGKIDLKVIGNPVVVRVEDSLGRPVYNNATRINDTLSLIYLEGNPTKLTLSTGETFQIPSLTKDQLPPPIYRKIDTTLISRIAVDSSILQRMLGKGPLSWEAGAMFGAATYRGDYRHKFSPLPSTMEFSGSAFLQYNARQNTAFRLSAWRTNISMHYRNAPALFSGMAPQIWQGSQGYFADAMGWRYAFLTKMGGLDFDMLMMLGDGRNYTLKKYQKGKWIPQLGLGMGVFAYTPFREYSTNVYDAQNKVVGSKYEMMNLRSVGTEGQNYLPGAKQYGKIAGSANVSFQLTYLMQKFAFHAEIKSVFTTTDYLDDFGSGVWYGGDIQKWYDASPEAVDPNTGLKPYSATMRDYYTGYVNQGYTVTQKRTKSLMPDGYFQFHMGLSYFLNDKTSKKLTKYASAVIPPEKKERTVKMKSLDEIKYATGEWQKHINVSFVGGGAMFIGDYRHKFFPMPSTIEISAGLTGEYNKSKNVTYRVGIYQTTVSMAYSNSIALFSSLKYPAITTSGGQKILVNMPNNWGFVDQLKIVDFDYIYLLNKQNTLPMGKKHQWNHKFSAGAGFLQYNPQRVEYWGSKKLIDLRDLKTNDKKYGSLAMLFSVGYHLEYMRKRWTLGGEIKYAMTTTDNLDDYNSGSKYFGGDVDQWYANSPEAVDANGIKPLSASMRDWHKNLLAAGLDPNAKKTGFLPDGYIQFHLKLSYRIFKDPISK
jgi:hypothetical protein